MSLLDSRQTSARTRNNGLAVRSVATPPTATTPAPQQPDAPELVRRRAFEIFEKRTTSGQAGDALTDWLQAESEVGGATSITDTRSRIRGETLLRDRD